MVEWGLKCEVRAILRCSVKSINGCTVIITSYAGLMLETLDWKYDYSAYQWSNTPSTKNNEGPIKTVAIEISMAATHELRQHLPSHWSIVCVALSTHNVFCFMQYLLSALQFYEVLSFIGNFHSVCENLVCKLVLFIWGKSRCNSLICWKCVNLRAQNFPCKN